MTTTVEATAAPFRYRPPARLTSLSVVMPAHNEGENIEAAILEALEAATSVSDRYEVVVVDDGSTDDTAAVVERLIATYGESVRLIRNEVNLGYGPTVRRALESARMDWILFTDSDCQFDLSEVALLVPLTDDADIVSGIRRNRQDTFRRRLNAHIFNAAGRAFFGTGVRDVDCAFKLIRRSALRGLELTATSAMINTELFYQARQHGLRVVEQPVTHLPRRFGEASGGDPRVIARAIREFFVMRHRFNGVARSRLRLHTRLAGLLAAVAGLLATWWTVANGHVLAYGDSEAHLNIAKRVVSGLTSGLAQLGSVWLPLPHLLMAPFVIHDDLWRTGLAGAAVGVPSLILLSVSSFKLAHLLTGSVAVSWLAPLVILANPNTLYLSATPMTEVLLLAMVTTSVYFLAKWIMKDGVNDLVLAGLFGCLATLSRYDGWALVCLEALAVGVIALVRHRRARSVEGLGVLFCVLAFSGIGAWLLWNQLIFGDPLYFADSVYGSAEQQQFFLRHGLLPTYHDLGESFLYWFEDVRLIAGATLGVLAAAGLVVLLARAVRHRTLGPVLIAGVALSCFAFYILSLYLGQASLILPRFAPDTSPYTMSNLRYGLQALLPIALFTAVLASLKPRILVPILAVVVLAQGVAQVATGRVMSFEDGTRGLSSQLVSKGPDSPPVEAWMRAHYDGGLVLMDDYRRPIGPVESGVPMSRFIGVGNKPYWAESLDNPGRWATWIILQQGETDAVWRGFTPQSRTILEDHFVEVYRSGSIHVYKRRPAGDGFVVKRGQHLYLGDQRWNAVGVNSYDLLEQTPATIETRLHALANDGHNTVRTWCFDADGGVTTETLATLDHVVRTAHGRGLRIICTLANFYDDFGGPAHFAPTGDFYSSEAARTVYRDQVLRILEHRGADGTRLADSPAILAWDLMNEPRPYSGTPDGAVARWTETMAGFIGSLDQRHLVTVGSEGFMGGYPHDPTLAGRPGADFGTLCSVPSITLCSVHLFPKYLSSPADVGERAQAWRAEADRLRKPVIMEEVGFSLSDGGDEFARAAFYAETAKAVGYNDLDGALLWNLGADADRTFTLSYADAASREVLTNWAETIPAAE
ncbi:glycosyltransferase [Catenuloplanes atrovinosus]|uniref:GT2 family glycosyltransferase n=1 Tax=Catenuloplanes atrovinosus TaxID=137266 RepID=A0AAE4CDW1_9ACTN|nr:glycosyltransferase [Catenuloplanes atrovinosus]MDR7277950.1 GT2 family glycosyltransferase [Catenuloplanes atrovinosus]